MPESSINVGRILGGGINKVDIIKELSLLNFVSNPSNFESVDEMR